MNRQERRRLAKQQAFEAKYEREIKERQNRIDDRTVELYTTCIGLAVYDCYGYRPTVAGRIITAFCNRLMTIDEGRTLTDFKQELKEKTGIELEWKR